MGAFIRFVLIGLVILFVYRLIKNALFPPQNKYNQSRQDHFKQKKNEGETTIHKRDKSDPSKGDYIDYEEIE
jgi:hypothetical protein